MDEPKSSNIVAIGINLGTSEIRASILRDGEIEVVPNGHDDSGVIPCFVSFQDAGCQVGFPALQQVGHSASNTVSGAKRLFGQCWEDHKAEDAKYWPTKLIENKNAIEFIVESTLETRQVSPAKVIFLLLKHVKKLVEKYVDDPTVTLFNAVVAVPSSFDYYQRQVIRELGAKAGLNIVQVLNDTIVTALTYGKMSLSNCKGDIRLLIFDFGAGFLNVSVITSYNGVSYTVNGTSCADDLGGRDLDKRLLQHFAPNQTLIADSSKLAWFLGKCEEMKIILSTKHEASFTYTDGTDPTNTTSYHITRTQFEELCLDLFNSALNKVNSALADAEMSTSDIDQVVLVGGSSKIPRIQQLLKGFFDGKLLVQLMNSNESFAGGAALLAAKRSQLRFPGYFAVYNVTTYSLGINSSEGDMLLMIERKSELPTTHTRSIVASSLESLAIDSDESESSLYPVLIRVYEGESKLAKDNYLLYTLKFNAASPESKIKLCFDVDADNILTVTASDESTENNEEVFVCLDKSDLLGCEGSGTVRNRVPLVPLVPRSFASSSHRANHNVCKCSRKHKSLPSGTNCSYLDQKRPRKS